jgi:hypothetical protein
MKFVLNRGPSFLSGTYAGLVEFHVGSRKTFRNFGNSAKECVPAEGGLVTIFSDRVWHDRKLTTSNHSSLSGEFVQVNGHTMGEIRMCYDTIETFCFVIKQCDIPERVRARFNEKGVMPWEEV